MGVRVKSGFWNGLPTLDLDQFVHTTVIFKAWNVAYKHWERLNLINEPYGYQVKPRRYGTYTEWGETPEPRTGAWVAWAEKDDEEFNGAQPIDWAAFAAVQGQGAALTPHTLIPLVQQSRNPAVMSKVKQGPWQENMIFNYAQPVAGLNPGITYRIISTYEGQDKDCLAGASAFLSATSHNVVPMDASKEWNIPKNTWGYGDDNRNTPDSVGPFTFLDRLRNGDAILRGMGHGFFQSAKLIQINLWNPDYPIPGDKWPGAAEFRNYTQVTLYYRLAQGSQIRYFQYGTALSVGSAEQDTGTPHKWTHWRMQPREITSDQASSVIVVPGDRPNLALLAGMDISNLQTTLPQTWNLYKYTYKKAWAIGDTMYITQSKQSIDPAVDGQVCYCWDAGVLLGTRTQKAVRYSRSTGRWNLLSRGRWPYLQMAPGNGTGSTLSLSQDAGNLTLVS